MFCTTNATDFIDPHFGKLLQSSTSDSQNRNPSTAHIIFYYPLNFLTVFTFQVL